MKRSNDNCCVSCIHRKSKVYPTIRCSIWTENKSNDDWNKGLRIPVGMKCQFYLRRKEKNDE